MSKLKIRITAFACCFIVAFLMQYFGHIIFNKVFIFDVKNALANSLVGAIIVNIILNVFVIKSFKKEIDAEQ